MRGRGLDARGEVRRRWMCQGAFGLASIEPRSCRPGAVIGPTVEEARHLAVASGQREAHRSRVCST